MAKQLFVKTYGSDDTWFHAGGAEDAHRGVANILQSDLLDILNGDLEIETFVAELQFDVREMTDAEVAAIPEA